MNGQILIIDDDAGLRRLVQAGLEKAGMQTILAKDGATGLKLLQQENPAAVVLDLYMPEMSGKEILQKIQETRPGLPVVVLTSSTGVTDVVDCMRLGAFDYVQKPFDSTRVVTSVRNALTQGMLKSRVELLTSELRSGDGFGRILGESSAIKKSIALLGKAAQSDVTLLLTGGSGTGKEVAARAVHAESPRRSAPFVAVNCGAIPEGLIESELFGHEKGSFTGATTSRAGRFEQADGGTLFLDEIGELRADLQVRLLRVLQERTVQRVGGSSVVEVDVRIIAATNRNLKDEAAKNNFREDLYFRLAVFPVKLPDLREREGDSLILANAFMNRFAARHGKSITGFTDDAQKALSRYSWPGNVRELENVIERSIILEDGNRISVPSLSDDVVSVLGLSPENGNGQVQANGIEAHLPSEEDSFSRGHETSVGQGNGSTEYAADSGILPLEEEEKRIVLRALKITGWNVQESASRLKIGRATIYRKIEKYDLKNSD